MNRKKLLKKVKDEFLSGVSVPEPSKFEVDTFQSEAIESVVNGIDTLVVAPTGAGKTYIAIESMRAALELGGRAIYTTPLKALSNTKYAELKTLFAPDFSVGLLTGDRKIEGDSNAVIATTEIYRNELYRYFERYSLVILDEVHFIADQQRGPVWEESIILTPSSSTLLMLSASISNAKEIAEWIEYVRGKPCKVVLEKKRPVDLRFGFLHPDYGVLPLRNSRGGLLKEVRAYYGNAGLDDSGMRVKGGRFKRPKSKGRSWRRGKGSRRK